MRLAPRLALPKPTDRLPLGRSGLTVSPICMGITGSPETVVAAYEAGVNFFFISADLHWPLYEPTRKGLEMLLRDNPTRRDSIVVGVVSYLDEPLFYALQFNEVIDSVPGLGRVDLLIAGAVSSDNSFYPRVQSLQRARGVRHAGSSAIGATFHQRPFAVVADYYEWLDISYIRYNTSHAKAREDLFPYLKPARPGLLYNFKSVMSRVSEEQFTALRLPGTYWKPSPTDYYRFVLSQADLDGILCSPLTPAEVKGLCRDLEKGPLSAEEQEYLIWLSAAAQSPVMA